ncbi:hypothetical protein GCM10010987_20470 [Bradyrhizobium guangdongense]|uniref:Extensin n=1 Tax=Bradyrhizobium guangdongense TaxID=1325090 RepID=A0A410V9H0_9BRAD|nr:hypothetical protein X265_23890 [Bradyrhizobium guangdongense]QOZ61436.1 hypothetical protein XH86_23910 [Bradyrhizobium guangdongense]GGI22652.1 hypothetical protein GCM10010987_20470 [Bradyrhizobium guangdongense]
MTREKSGLDRLGLLVILFGMMSAAASAQTQLQPPTAPVAEPTVHDARVPRNDQTDGNFTRTPSAGPPSPMPDVKRIRTTDERITDDTAPPAVAPLQPPSPKP